MTDKKPVTYIPLGDKLIVDIDKAETQKNGIELPASSQERPNTGQVIAIGPGTTVNGKLQTLDHLKGKRVLLMRHSGLPIMHGGKECIIVKEHEVLAVEG